MRGAFGAWHHARQQQEPSASGGTTKRPRTAIWSSEELPIDMDVTKPSVVVALVAKSGATGGDTMTLDVGLYQQVPGALEDATTNLGGTTSAIAAPTATAQDGREAHPRHPCQHLCGRPTGDSPSR